MVFVEKDDNNNDLNNNSEIDIDDKLQNEIDDDDNYVVINYYKDNDKCFDLLSTGLLVDLTKVINLLSILNPYDYHGANIYNHYYLPVFDSITEYIDNIPVIKFNNCNEFILMELQIPDDENYLNDINVFNITPYFYTYKNDEVVFASTDQTIEFFMNKIYPGRIIKIIFTFSETIGNLYHDDGYIVSKLPSEYINDVTFTFILRIGSIISYEKQQHQQLSGQQQAHKTSALLMNTTLTLNEMINDNINLYTSKTIIKTFPKVYGSILIYENTKINKIYDRTLLISYKYIYQNEINYYKNNKNNLEIKTYLFKQNLSNPEVKYAFQSFYEAISVRPFMNLQGNNTGENYYNSDIIHLNNYKNKNKIIILACNQLKFGYGLTSNIQIYDMNGFNVIDDGFYDTSPQIPSINSINYPYLSSNNSNNNDNNHLMNYNKVNNHNNVNIGDLNDKYPLINKKVIDINNLSSHNINDIFIIERVCYNPINFNHSNYYEIPRFSIFITD
jgi:hypothetical protein